MTGPPGYPTRNPFPSQGTSTASDNTADLVHPASPGPTLLLKHVTTADDYVGDYLRTYGKPDVSRRIIVLNGEHGSGKTHTIQYLIDRIAKGPPPANEGIGKPVQVSAKVESADFLTTYQLVMGKISLPLLQEVALLAFTSLAAEQWIDSATTDESKRLILERLKTDDKAAMDAFTRYLVDRDAVAARQAENLSKLPLGAEDFQRAVPFLLSANTELAGYAYKWLIGEAVEGAAIRALGVSGGITSLETCKSAFQLVTSLFDRARRPLIIYLDQYEKLLVKDGGASATQIAQNLSVLARLVEKLPENNALLVIAGTDEAWQVLSPDVRARFAPGLVFLPRLSAEQAADLVAEYIVPTRPRLDQEESVSDAERLYPFTAEGLDAVYRFSRGNVRSLLQACFAVFEAAAPCEKEIDARFVNESFENSLLSSPVTIDAVRAALEKQLTDEGVRWSRDHLLISRRVDYAVFGSGETPTLLLQVKRSAFYDGEADDALKLLHILEESPQVDRIRPRVALIVLGYVSKRVTELLGKNIDQVVYDPKTFGREVNALLSSVRSEPRAAASAREQKLATDLEAVQAELRRVRDERERDVDRLEERLRQFVTTAVRPAESAGLIRERWADERRRIESEIHEARSSRKNKAFEQLRDASKRSERMRLKALIMIFLILIVLIGVLAAVVYWIGPPSAETQSARSRPTIMPAEGRSVISSLTVAPPLYRNPFLYAGLASGALAVFFTLYYFHMFARRGIQTAAPPAASLAELEQLQIKSEHAKRLLRHRSPQVRWVARKNLRQPTPDDALLLIEQLPNEQFSLVRTATIEILKNMEIRFFPPSWLHPLSKLPELPSLGEKLEVPDDRRDVQLVQAIAAMRFDNVFTLLLSEGNGDGASTDTVSIVASAFSKGEIVGADGLVRQTVRQAIRQLSPLDEGIGTLELECIDVVDELFLFFRREIFVADRRS
jgi:Cdc6-like AAA superfamily ATPase